MKDFELAVDLWTQKYNIYAGLTFFTFYFLKFLYYIIFKKRNYFKHQYSNSIFSYMEKKQPRYSKVVFAILSYYNFFHFTL